MPSIRSIRDRWAPALSLLLGILLLVPVSPHGGSNLVLCVESDGAVNVERSQSDECSSPTASADRGISGQAIQTQSSEEHCPGCRDLPLVLPDATDTCESAVLSSSTAVGNAATVCLTTNEQDFQTSDFRIARLHRRPLRPRAPKTAPQSFRREWGHLFSDTSVDRAKSSVELLI